jgi:hypothetical protein
VPENNELVRVGTIAPIANVWREARARAAPLGTYPNALIAASTLLRRSALTIDGLLMARDTVAVETSAIAATSAKETAPLRTGRETSGLLLKTVTP